MQLQLTCRLDPGKVALIFCWTSHPAKERNFSLPQLSPEPFSAVHENIMSAVNRVLSKSLRLQKTYPSQAARSVSLLNAGGASSRASGFSARSLSRTTTTTTTRSSPFHTMASLQSASATTPKPSEGVGYDPEIKDIANYIHNYKVDSDLAVSSHLAPAITPQPAANRRGSLSPRSVRHRALRLPRHARLRP